MPMSFMEYPEATGKTVDNIRFYTDPSGAPELHIRFDDSTALTLRFYVPLTVEAELYRTREGDVIGLFLTERIPYVLPLTEVVGLIRGQGGLVYVPHPFDRFHSVPDYEHLLDIVEEVDLLEVFNPRVALTAFNEEAVRFASKYRIVPAAGSDSHVAQGLGSVRIRMRDFDGPAEFLQSLRDADILTRPSSLFPKGREPSLSLGGSCFEIAIGTVLHCAKPLPSRYSANCQSIVARFTCRDRPLPLSTGMASTKFMATSRMRSWRKNIFASPWNLIQRLTSFTSSSAIST